MSPSHIVISLLGAVLFGWRLAEHRQRARAHQAALDERRRSAGPSPIAVRQAMRNQHPALKDPAVRYAESVERNQMRNTLHAAYLRNLDTIRDAQWLQTPIVLSDAPMPSLAQRRPVFKGDEPQTLDQYIGQRAICEQLSLAIQALEPNCHVLPHKLLTGLPGFGKTLLAKIIAKTLDDRAAHYGTNVQFVETYAANLNSVEALDTLVKSFDADAWTIWFIDEIHVLNKELATKLYLLMEDGRYPFEGALTPTALPRVMLLGATTDYGMLHPALKRRFGEGLMLQPLTRSELLRMVKTLQYPIDDAAADQLVARCVHSGAPHELKTLFNECVVVAKATRSAKITPEVVRQVCTTFGVDDMGLRPIDRKIITALLARPRYTGRAHTFVGYGASENDVCMAAGVDKGEFRDVIRPRLLVRGLLEVRAGLGLALTQRAVSLYET